MLWRTGLLLAHHFRL